MNYSFLRTLFFLLTLMFSLNLSAQKISLKTNMLEWALATPNLGMEITPSKRVSIELNLAYSPFKFDNFSTEHYSFTPEVKFWLGMPSIGHAIGFAATASYGELGLKNKHLDGMVAGFGPTYTYAFILSEHWNFELTCGLAAYYYAGFRYDSETPKAALPDLTGWMVGPIKWGATFVYLIK